MTVSIIVPAFNCAPYIRSCLDSLQAQSFPDIEVVVVDDGSTDDTVGIARQVAARDSRIKVLSQPPSGRAAAARNAGLRASTGEFVAFLDADDLYHQDKIQIEMSAFGSRPELGIVFCDVARFIEEGTMELQPGFLQELDFLALAGNHLQHAKGSLYVCGDRFYNFMSSQVTSLCTPSVMIRRSVLLEEPYWFDEELDAGEDVDLWFRLARRCHIGFVAEVLAYYRQRDGSLTSDSERVIRGAIDAHAANLERGAGRLSYAEITIMKGRLARQYRVLGHLLLTKGDHHGARTAYLNCRQLDQREFSATAFAKTYIPGSALAFARKTLARFSAPRKS